MNQKQFIEQVFEIAYGENAINRNFTFEEVIETLREFSDNALIFEEPGLTEQEIENISEISQESYKKGYIQRGKDELLKKC